MEMHGHTGPVANWNTLIQDDGISNSLIEVVDESLPRPNFSKTSFFRSHFRGRHGGS